jgi:hypothetical protein
LGKRLQPDMALKRRVLRGWASNGILRREVAACGAGAAPLFERTVGQLGSRR